MARTSRDLDKKLMIVGQTLIQEIGVSRLSLREVARLANVNLGMINYYFKGKDDFILKVLLEVYRPFIEELERLSQDIKEPQGFENFLFELAKFSRDNRKLILILMKDILSDDPNVKKFILSNFGVHFKLIKKALETRLSSPQNIESAMRFIIASIGMPNLIAGFQEIIFDDKKIKLESDEDLKRRVLITIESMKYFSPV